MAKIKNSGNIECWQGYGETEQLIHCQQEYQMTQPFWKIILQFIIKLNMQLPCSQRIKLEYLSQKNEKFCSYQNFCMNIHNCFFVIVKNWKKKKSWNAPDGLQWMN